MKAETKHTLRQHRRPDSWLALFIALLLLAGLIMLYSVSTVESLEKFGSTSYFLSRQLWQGAGLGLLAMWLCFRIPLDLWRRLAPFAVMLSLLLLLLVKAPGVGFAAGGASRWIHFGPFFFQPAEFAKLAVVLYAAAWLAAKKNMSQAGFWNGIMPMLAIVGLYAALLLWQPDFGTMISLLGTVAAMIIASGVPGRWIASLLATGGAAVYLLIHFEPYRAKRLLTFLKPEIDPLGAGYQIKQAFLAIGSGGLWGLGYGLSRQKHNFLPEAMSDAVFAVIAEELGFVRLMLIILLFVFLCGRGFYVAASAPDNFQRLLAVGIVSMLGVQVVINLGAIIGMLPLTGIPLPFFSYGSSALLVNLAALGILLRISANLVVRK